MVDVPRIGASDKGHGLACPSCRIDLVMSERQGIEIDYCPKCRGVWLDRGELDKIIEKSLVEDGSGGQRQPSPPAPEYPSQDSYRSGHGGHGSGHGQGRRHGSFLGRLFD